MINFNMVKRTFIIKNIYFSFILIYIYKGKESGKRLTFAE